MRFASLVEKFREKNGAKEVKKPEHDQFACDKEHSKNDFVVLGQPVRPTPW